MKRSLLHIALTAFFILLLTGCAFSDARDDEATKLVESYMQAIQDQDYDKALSMVSDDFLQERGRDGWISYYTHVHNTLGNISNLKLKQKISDARYSARFYMYQYANAYENGLAKELITIIQKINTNEPLKIGGHKIESSKLPEMPR
ncbi:MAG: nuclear transport factor 2 family protein [Gammaproteobacteria bacterium]|nr:nuclear transport factor 2 family protein [Gammaproteobacteria bacterium]